MVTLGLIIRRVDAIPALFMGILAGVVCTLVFQQELLASLIAGADDSRIAIYDTLMTTLFSGIAVPTENEMLNDLFSTSGMEGMLGTIWLILAAMAFGGVMEATGMLRRILSALRSVVSGFLA